ncbi:MAG TPA: hypothetical protein VJC03_01010 [bacterium]|nr:hypothetical protein [bacterium]
MILLFLLLGFLRAEDFSLKGEKMFIREKGNVYVLEKNVTFRRESTYLQADRVDWSKEKDSFQARENVYFLVKDTGTELEGSGGRALYSGAEKKMWIKKIDRIKYNYKVARGSGTVTVRGEEGEVDFERDEAVVRGIPVLMNTEEWEAAGGLLTYTKEKLQLTDMKYLRSLQSSFYFEAEELFFYPDRERIVLKGGVRGTIPVY